MLANPPVNDWSNWTVDDLVKRCKASLAGSLGGLTIVLPTAAVYPFPRLVSWPRSIGGTVVGFIKAVTSTASAHTMLTTVYFPDIIVSANEVEASHNERSAAQSTFAEALSRIKQLTGWSNTAIATNLFDVSKVAYHAWATGTLPRVGNQRRITNTLDILERAAARFRTSDEFRSWLVTPVGSRANTPEQLIRECKFDEARLLAITTARPRTKALPSWMIEASIKGEGARSQRRRSISRDSVAVEAKGYLDLTDDDE